ncbi:Potassium channel domain [Trinorchestia longiramus]|nr:Potassium channel domain [Trinorchestia longiramus]
MGQKAQTAYTPWTYGESFLFCITLVTTVGYGNRNELSDYGKWFCIVFSSFGIPMTVILLRAFVERMILPAQVMFNILTSNSFIRRHGTLLQLLQLLTIVSIISIITVVVPAFLFRFVEEKWSYLDALYFCFMTVTTIGLGDYVPGSDLSLKNREAYLFFVSFYLLVGVTAVMLMLRIYQENPHLTIGIYLLPQADAIKHEDRVERILTDMK